MALLAIGMVGCVAPAVKSSVRPQGGQRWGVPIEAELARTIPAGDDGGLRSAPVERSAEAEIRVEDLFGSPDAQLLWRRHALVGEEPWQVPRAAGPQRQAPAPEGDLLGGWVFDFGVGEAPYDDGPRRSDSFPARKGFSDSVLSLGYGGDLGGGARWESGITAIRFQDQPLLEGLGDTELGWVTLGVRFRF